MIRDDQPPMDPHENRVWLVEEYPDRRMQFCRAMALGEWWMWVAKRSDHIRQNPPQPDASCPEG